MVVAILAFASIQGKALLPFIPCWSGPSGPQKSVIVLPGGAYWILSPNSLMTVDVCGLLCLGFGLSPDGTSFPQGKGDQQGRGAKEVKLGREKARV